MVYIDGLYVEFELSFTRDHQVEEVVLSFCSSLGSSGFREESLRDAISGTLYKRKFPEGLRSLISYLERMFDQQLTENTVFEVGASVSGKVETAVFDRLMLYHEWPNHAELVKGICSFFKKPNNWLFATDNFFRSGDNIWSNLIRDDSTGFSFYSKRVILAGLYSKCFYCFADDSSPEYVYTQRHLSSMIAKVRLIGKYKSKIKKYF